MHPVLFRIPIPGWNLPLLGKVSAIPIYSYGVMLGLSLVVGWYLTLGLAQKDGLDREQMANCYVVTALVAVLGSRIVFLITNPAEYHSISDLFAFRGGGLVAYGGFLGGFAGSYVFLRIKGKRLLPWADVAVPSLASGLAITRLGCFLYGCDYGRLLPGGAPAWLKRIGSFPKWPEGTLPEGSGSPAWVEHLNRKLIEPGAKTSLPVHPTQIYEALVGLLLLALLLWVRKTQRFRGQVFFIATFAYGLIRFLLELVRDDPERGSLPIAQAEHVLIPICLLLFAAGYTQIAKIIEDARVRTASIAVAFAAPVLAAIKMYPGQFAPPEPTSLSTSQFIGLASALVVAGMYSVHDRAARAHPEAAMALDDDATSGAKAADRADDPADDPADEGERDAADADRETTADGDAEPKAKPTTKPKRAKKKKKGATKSRA
jgi:phosphatidylglycerol:prolipoprotein diacylglycerol transferase